MFTGNNTPDLSPKNGVLSVEGEEEKED